MAAAVRATAPPAHTAAAAAAARPRLARPAPARRQLAAPPAAGLFGGLLDTVAAANAEGLARKEAGLVGAERGLKSLPAVPQFVLEDAAKAAEWASLLERQGCLGIQGALSTATAVQLLQFIQEENARCQADVEAGRVEFDARFGGVNCR